MSTSNEKGLPQNRTYTAVLSPSYLLKSPSFDAKMMEIILK